MRKPPLWLRLAPSRYIINMATLGPVGRVGKAPGTAGTAVGLLWFTFFFYQASPFIYLFVGGLSVAFAVAVCGEAEIRLGKRDPGEIVLDEFVAVPFCYMGLQPYLVGEGSQGWAIILAGFVIFRIFDILKPFGISRLQKIEGGAGVVVDDLAAAGATAICLHILVRVVPFFG